MDGLQGINPIFLAFTVKTTVLHPILALAKAASQPAWPVPITKTSHAPDIVIL
jgi:hypothetical protein